MSEIRRRENITPRERAAEALVGQGPVTGPPEPASSGETVCVACNLPNGLILRLFDMVETTEATPSGHRTIRQARVRPDVEVIVVNGSAIDVDRLRRGRLPEFNAVHGYALTPGVPKDFWDEWLHQNERAPYVRNHCIFAMSSENSARRKVAMEMSNMPSGLEPIDPDNPASKSPELRGLNTLTNPGRSGAGQIERGERG